MYRPKCPTILNHTSIVDRCLTLTKMRLYITPPEYVEVSLYDYLPCNTTCKLKYSTYLIKTCFKVLP